MPKDPQSTITCFFGLRFFAMVWTLVGHSFIFVQAFLENVDDYKVGRSKLKCAKFRTLLKPAKNGLD